MESLELRKPLKPFEKESSGDILIKCILFFISPFFAFVYSLLTMNRRSSYLFFFLFAIFWCMIQNVQMGRFGEYRSDINVYRYLFTDMTTWSWFDYMRECRSYFNFNADSGKDIFATTLMFLVGRFTTNYHIFFMVVGAIVSYFMLRCFRFITCNYYFSNGIQSLIIAIMFSMHLPLYWIGGVRWVVAGWIMIYCVYNIFVFKKYVYWLLLFITPLIHFSFWLYVLTIIIIFITKKHTKIWFVLLLSSFVIQVIVSIVYDKIISADILPMFLMGNGGDEDFQLATELLIENSILPIKITKGYLAPIFPTILCIIFMHYKKTIIQDKYAYRMMLFAIPITFFYNVYSILPEIGTRLGWTIFSFYAFILIVTFHSNKYNWIRYLYIIIFAIPLIITIYEGQWTTMTQLEDWFTNPITLINKYLINPV